MSEDLSEDLSRDLNEDLSGDMSGDLSGDLNGDLVIERSIELDLPSDQLWNLVSTPEGWRRWLVDSGDVEVREGGEGRVTDGDVDREVRIGTVDHSRGVTFTWWDREDPSTVSEVRIAIVHRDDGVTEIAITERIPSLVVAASAMSASAAEHRLDDIRFAWEVRACVAWASTCSVARV